MDKQRSAKREWSWLPAFMPGIAAALKAKRREHGDEHLDECWKRGVVNGEPGWFFAWEGPLSVGTTDDAALLAMFVTVPGRQRSRHMLVLRDPQPMQVHDGKS